MTPVVAALWLLVLSIVGGDPGDATAATLEATLREALEGIAEIVVAPAPGGPARPIVRLTVTLTRRPAEEVNGAETTTGTLVLVDGDGAELMRQVVFTGADALGERGRTLAFVALSMLPGVSPPEVTATVTSPRAATTATHATPRAPAPRTVAASPRAGPIGLELRGVASLGVADAGASTSYGGALGAIWAPWERLALRLDLGARAGAVDVAQASTLWLVSTLGLSVVAVRARGAVDLDLELSLGAGLGRQTLSHYSADDPVAVTDSTWAFVGRGGVALAWYVGPGFALLADVGAEVVAQRMPVYVGGSLRATLEPVRPTVGVGLRVSL